MLVSPGRIGAIGAAARRRGGGSALDRILGAGGLDYGFFDFTQTDRTFQESVGPTPADDIGEAVGLWLDRHGQGSKTLAQVMAGQVELVTNGTFDTDLSGWTDASTAPSAYTWADGAAVGNGTVGAACRLRTSFGTVAGRMYRITAGGTASYAVSTAAGGADLLGFSNMLRTRYFVASSTTTWINTADTSPTTLDNVSVKEVPSHYALQATGNARGVRQADGIKYDGSDDNHLTDWLAQAGANCIIAKVTVPAIVSATQIIAGSGGASSMHCGVNTSGQIVGGMGSVTSSTIKGSIDRRGASVIIAIASDGASITHLFDGDAGMVYEAAFAGTMPPSTALRIGALNNGGSAANWFGGSIDKIAFGKVALTLSQFQQITAEWAD